MILTLPAEIIHKIIDQTHHPDDHPANGSPFGSPSVEFSSKLLYVESLIVESIVNPLRVSASTSKVFLLSLVNIVFAFSPYVLVVTGE